MSNSNTNRVPSTMVLRAFVSIILLVSISGCMAAEDAIQVNVNEVMFHPNCEDIEPGVHPISLAKVAAIRGARLLTQPANTDPSNTTPPPTPTITDSTTPSPAPATTHPSKTPSIEPKQDAPGTHTQAQVKAEQRTPSLFSVFDGARPTSGYSLRLSRLEESLENANKNINIHLKMHTPAPDAPVAQMITRPCVVIEISGLPEDITPRFYIDDSLLKGFY